MPPAPGSTCSSTGCGSTARDELCKLLRAAKAPRLRTLREWAEEELIIPDGPYKGRRFRVSRQPYAGLWFDAVDSGRWSRICTTGPTQSGKTLMAFIIPVLYHLFEIGETVIVGVPDLMMSGDKWRQDLLPAILASRYRDLLPKSGAGSRGGGKIDSITFRNGATLRFMSGGGGDKARAGFTARVVVITETDGMDEAGETSREADPITQLEARTKAYPGTRRIYMECTVSIEDGRTWSEYQGGTTSKIYEKCPHCEAFVHLERQHFVGWQSAETVEEAREKGHWACESCGTAWSEDDRKAANESAILLHRGQDLEDDGTITGDIVETDTLGFRWTSTNNRFTTAAEVSAEEWRAARSPDADLAEVAILQFVWALPHKPGDIELRRLDPQAISRRVTNEPKGLVPDRLTTLTVGVDVGGWLHHWVAVGFDHDGSPHIVDYGKEDVPSADMTMEAAILASLRSFRDAFVTPGWPRMGEGGSIKPAHVLVDAGYQGREKKVHPVYEFIKESGPPFHASKGFAAGQTMVYSAPKAKNVAVAGIGDGYHFARIRNRRIKLVEVDVDSWKGEVHDRLAIPVGNPGALTLYNAQPVEHLSMARHLTSERLIEQFKPGQGAKLVWERLSRSNHWFDALALALVAGHMAGVRLTGRAEPVDQSHGKAIAWYAQKRRS